MDRGGLAEAEEGGDGEDNCELHIEFLVRLDSAKVDEFWLSCLLWCAICSIWCMVYKL